MEVPTGVWWTTSSQVFALSKGPTTYELCPGFLTVSQPRKGGAEGPLEAALNALTGLYTSKLIGITTDSESANTGKDHGL